MKDFSSYIYDGPKTWIRNTYYDNGDWDKIRLAEKSNEYELKSFLDNAKVYRWPELSVEDWKDLVDSVRIAEEHRVGVDGFAELVKEEPQKMYAVPTAKYSSWVLYKKRLNESGFHPNAINQIEESSIGVLRNLREITQKDNPVRGLVVGSVQSGKTANMAGLMAMAADYGWNMFIVLSGTIENLREQTQTRLHKDLSSEGILIWRQINNPKAIFCIL